MLTLLEIALVDKYGPVGQDQSKQLEERLASLLNPKKYDSTQSQLNLIDHYLGVKNGEKIIGEALDIIKPVFLTQVGKMFEK